MKMVYSVDKTLSLLCIYYRSRTFVNGEFVYFVTVCEQKYLAKYPDFQIQETSLKAHIRNVINRFVRTGSVNEGKSPGRPSVAEEVVNNLRRLEQNPQTSLTRLSQQSGVPVAT